MFALAAVAVLSATSLASALVFRPPAVPLLTQSPLFSSWSRGDGLATPPSFWTGDAQDWFLAARVDGVAYALVGSYGSVQPAQQLGYSTVRATQTIASFAAGPALINLTFTSPLLLDDWDLLSRPAHYVTFDVSSADGASHAVSFYMDMTGWLVANDPTTLFSWQRLVVPSMTGGASATALQLGAAQQAPLGGSDPTNDRPSWGMLYLLADDDTTTTMSLQYGATSRQWFLSNGTLPPADLNNNAPLALVDPATNTALVASAVISLTAGPSTTAVTSAHLTVAIDEFITINWFGMESLPPYWRRALPVGNTSVVPFAMLSQAVGEYEAVITACDLFDQQTSDMLTRVGGEEYAAIGQLVYRQVLGQMALAWVPSKNDVYYFLKEASSCGCLQTADVLFPMFPILAYYSPELLKRTLLPNLEYAMNFTNQPYPLPFAPHHIGFWPLADLPYTKQENMPLEETAWSFLSIAITAQRQGGDLTWLTPYWPLMNTWYDFLTNLLPFPGTQLSTDDFDGVLYNASNLAIKGVAAIASAGYIFETFTGNQSQAIDAYTTAALYSQTFVQYSWLNGTNNNGPSAANSSHFLIGYKGSQGDGGDVGSWAMEYNLLWLKLFGYEALLPNQQALLAQQQAWYQQYQMNEYGLPLNSRKSFTKLDWMTFLAASYYENGSPSPFSAQLFSALFRFANETSSREPLSDWTNTVGSPPTAVGFLARPVFGAMWAPALVAQMQAEAKASSTEAKAAASRANTVFAAVHEQMGY